MDNLTRTTAIAIVESDLRRIGIIFREGQIEDFWNNSASEYLKERATAQAKAAIGAIFPQAERACERERL